MREDALRSSRIRYNITTEQIRLVPVRTAEVYVRLPESSGGYTD